jgi:hypothetical protein
MGNCRRAMRRSMIEVYRLSGTKIHHPISVPMLQLPALSVTRWDVTPRNASLGLQRLYSGFQLHYDGGTHAPTARRPGLAPGPLSHIHRSILHSQCGAVLLLIDPRRCMGGQRIPCCRTAAEFYGRRGSSQTVAQTVAHRTGTGTVPVQVLVVNPVAESVSEGVGESLGESVGESLIVNPILHAHSSNVIGLR